MDETRKSSTTRWEVSILEIQENNKILYKITRRIPELNVAETKIFSSKIKAKEQFLEWLK